MVMQNKALIAIKVLIKMHANKQLVNSEIWKTAVWAFFKTSPFVFQSRKKIKHVWNDMWVSWKTS